MATLLLPMCETPMCNINILRTQYTILRTYLLLTLNNSFSNRLHYIIHILFFYIHAQTSIEISSYTAYNIEHILTCTVYTQYTGILAETKHWHTPHHIESLCVKHEKKSRNENEE